MDYENKYSRSNSSSEEKYETHYRRTPLVGYLYVFQF